MSTTEQAEKRVSLDTSVAKASSENGALTQRWKRCSTEKQTLIQPKADADPAKSRRLCHL
jgi:hypothetical protein